MKETIYNTHITRPEKRSNRLQMQHNRLCHQQKQKNNMLRQKRTRTLIQIGGLVEKSGLLDAFDIHTGEDLQDPTHLHKAAQILGFLKTMHDEHDLQNKEDFQTLGATILLKGSGYIDCS